jgi:hypothetical protein
VQSQAGFSQAGFGAEREFYKKTQLIGNRRVIGNCRAGNTIFVTHRPSTLISAIVSPV